MSPVRTRAVSAAVIASLFATFSPPASAGPDAASLAGVYKHLQAPTTEEGRTFRNEDILEIVPYGKTKDKAYFRLYMRFAKGHVCDATGIALTTRLGLKYVAVVDGNSCSMTISFTPKGLEVQDSGDQCRMAFCGARGGLNWTSPIRRADRRPIRYGKRILESDMYANAVKIEEKASASKPPQVPAP
ncbi:hypothetical protein [Methylobacterium goesingense]|uniref:Uncharacterized protein n=1 Tax=Methylobacterium goesingense TaxID=243690 RepID=A0ABV2LCP2_9HYPH|nr:hypothetical protein [Methylobacterium goesingense]GJD74119.1 hypothetical protein CFIICLFH_2352 [Methylobacterium goesingense]